jgi:hypothetical protein
MATTQLPDTELSTLELTDRVHQLPDTQHPTLRIFLRTGVYLSAAGLGLLAAPLLFMLASRDTALHWANLVLDFVAIR